MSYLTFSMHYLETQKRLGLDVKIKLLNEFITLYLLDTVSKQRALFKTYNDIQQLTTINTITVSTFETENSRNRICFKQAITR